MHKTNAVEERIRFNHHHLLLFQRNKNKGSSLGVYTVEEGIRFSLPKQLPKQRLGRGIELLLSKGSQG